MAMYNTPNMVVDPDGEFGIFAAIFAKTVFDWAVGVANNIINNGMSFKNAVANTPISIGMSVNSASQLSNPVYEKFEILKGVGMTANLISAQISGFSSTYTPVGDQWNESSIKKTSTNGGAFGWIETGCNYTGVTAYVSGLANRGRKILEVEYIRQAKFNNGIAAVKNAKVVSSIKAISKTGKVLGVIGTATTYGIAAYQLATGADNTSTWIDIGITTGIVVVAIISAPVAVGAGIIYGGTRLIWSEQIDGWINNNWGYR